MDLPSGMGYNLLPLVWSQREKRTREIKKKETGTGEGKREVTDKVREESDK